MGEISGGYTHCHELPGGQEYLACSTEAELRRKPPPQLPGRQAAEVWIWAAPKKGRWTPPQKKGRLPEMGRPGYPQ